MYCAMIGDLVNSRTLSEADRQEVQIRLKSALQEVDVKWRPSIAARFIITLGDEFQGLLHADGPCVEIAEHIRNRLYPQQVRFGIGYGDIHTEINPDMALGADGPAYHLARSGLEELKSSGNRESDHLVRIRTQSPDERLLDLVCDDLNHLKSNWTDKQRAIIRAIESSDLPQKVLAEQMGLNPSTVTRHLQAARYVHYRRCLEGLGTYLVNTYGGRSADMPSDDASAGKASQHTVQPSVEPISDRERNRT